MNCKMPDLKRALEQAGFTDVKTLLSSGNAVFTAASTSTDALKKRAEAAMTTHLGKSFDTIVRPVADLQALIDRDPFAAHKVPANAKRIVTFLSAPHEGTLALPIHNDGVHVYAVSEREALLAYEPNPKGPVFMTLIEKTFGKRVTTRTWDTVQKCARA